MEALILNRISELLTVRRLYRQNRWSATWSEARKAQEAELRALVRLVRQWRRVEAARPDPVTQAKAAEWRAWTPGELAEAFGS
jgi:hypothetical protein